MNFFRYIPPRGEKRNSSISLPPDLEKLAEQMQVAGWQFDIERLMTGEFSVTCCNQDGPLAMEIAYYPIPLAEASAVELFSGLVQKAYAAWEKIGKVNASDWNAEEDNLEEEV